MNKGQLILNGIPNLTELGKRIVAINVANGWDVTTPEDRTGGDPYKLRCKGALVVSELSEALEAYRKGDKENFAEELADAAIRVLDCVSGLGYDPQQALEDSADSLAFVAENRHSQTFDPDIVDAVLPQWFQATAATLLHLYDSERAFWFPGDVSGERTSPYAVPAAINDLTVLISVLFAQGPRLAEDPAEVQDWVTTAVGVVLALDYLCDVIVGRDLFWAINEKLEKNASRGFRHGGKAV